MRGIVLMLLMAAWQTEPLEFEVASMKALSGGPFLQRTADDAQIHYPSVSLLNLIREAYHLNRPEQVDGPAWMRIQAYDIEAKLPPNASKRHIPEMLQALLVERLKLSVHHEMRMLPTNVLLAGKKVKLHPAAAQDDMLDFTLDGPLVHISGRGSIQKLIDQLNHGIGRDPWVDETGLRGVYEIKLDFALDLPSTSPLTQREDFQSTPQIAQALEQQLGLHLEWRKAPADIIVVDHVEKVPAER